MSNADELKNRIEAKKFELKKELAELKADASEEKRGRIEAIEGKLDKLEDHVRSGWKNLSDSVADKLNEWLKDDDPK